MDARTVRFLTWCAAHREQPSRGAPMLTRRAFGRSMAGFGPYVRTGRTSERFGEEAAT
jgi:hypothetical protein